MFRKSGKYIFGLTILTSVVIWILGVIFAGNNVFAFSVPSSWDFIYSVEHPSWVANANVNDCHSLNNQNLWTNYQGFGSFRLYNNNVNCGGTFDTRRGDIIVIQIYGITGILDIGHPDTFTFADSYLSVLSVDVVDTYDASLYTIYGIYTYDVNGVNPHLQLYARNSNGFEFESLTIYRSSSPTLSQLDELSACHNNGTCESKFLKEWVYTISTQVSGVSSTVSTISTNVSDIEDILDNLDTSIQDIADNSDEELETNKTEKSNIENQTPQNAGLEGDYSKTTSLITAVSTVVSDLGNISAGDSCVISGNLGNWDGVGINMGDLDLCSLPVPVYVSTGLSLVLVVILIGLMISLIRLMIATFYASVPTGA